MTPESVDEAIRLASDEKAARRLLDAYVLQARPGWGNGPLIGNFSTPFARVVQAALAARKRGDSFAAADVSSGVTVPELHVIALSQPSANDDSMIATVLSVVLAVRGSQTTDRVVQPVRTLPLTKEYQTLTGTAFERAGVVAVFPLDALVSGIEVRVEFSRTARGASALSMCRECVVPLTLERIR